MSKKQTVFNLLFLVVVFGLTMYLVFRGKDIGDIISTAREADARYLLLSIVCVVLFILGESVIIFYMMRTLGTSVKMGHCALYSFVGFFFSCITPSASGGQPMQIFYMKKDKLPIPVTTLVLMIVTITYKAVLVVIGLVICLFGGGFLRGYLGDYMWVFYLGVGLNVFCVTFMMILVFAPGLAKWIMVTGLKLIEHIRILKPRKSRLEKLEASMDPVPRDCSILGQPQKSDPECVSDHLCPEMHFVYCDLLGIPCPGTSFLWNPDDYHFASRDLCVCGYASSAGRHGESARPCIW